MSFQDIIYRHRKGHFYRIVHFGLDEETLEPEVAYRRCDDKGKFLDRGPPFHRLCTVFFDGRFTVYEEPDAVEDEIMNIFADDVKTYKPFEGAKPVVIIDEPRDVLVLDERAFIGEMEEKVPGQIWVEKTKTPTERQVEAGWPEGFGDGKL